MQDDFKCQSGGNNVMDFKVIMNINKTYVEQEV
jgi:hypothetical protein